MTLLMQILGNPNHYIETEHGKTNGTGFGTGGSLTTSQYESYLRISNRY